MTTNSTGEWLTYAEAGRRLGITTAAARQLSRRRGWQRRTPNAYGVAATILVPEDALQRPPQVTADPTREPHKPNGVGDTGAVAFALAQLEDRIAEQAETIRRERQRADRAEHQLEELQPALADAVGAERLAAGEAAALRAELDTLRKRRRRWFRW